MTSVTVSEINTHGSNELHTIFLAHSFRLHPCPTVRSPTVYFENIVLKTENSRRYLQLREIG